MQKLQHSYAVTHGKTLVLTRRSGPSGYGKTVGCTTNILSDLSFVSLHYR
jgi:hypothetical protein